MIGIKKVFKMTKCSLPDKVSQFKRVTIRRDKKVLWSYEFPEQTERSRLFEMMTSI